MNFVVTGTNCETKIQENKKQINNSSTTSEPDYKFDTVKIELHGKCSQYSLPGGTYSPWWRIRVPFTDYELLYCYCFKFNTPKIPGRQLMLTEGYFDIKTPDGQTLIVQFDGDTHIDYVSCFVKQNRDYHAYYLKGTLNQGVEIYL